MTETAKSFLTRAEGQVVTVQLSDTSSAAEDGDASSRETPSPLVGSHDGGSLARDRQLRGKLAGADEFINLVLEDAEELGPKGTRKIAGPVVVRGSQVTAIHATKLGPPVAAPVRETVWSGRGSDRGGYYPSRRDAGDRGWARRRE